MKKIIYLLAAITIVSCTNEPKDYVTFSGKITDQNSDSIVIRSREYSKTITVNEDGTFSDTLKVESGIYTFYDGGESTSIFLQNGFDIYMTLDTKMFDETATYTGEGSESSNFLAQNSLFQEQVLDSKDFDSYDRATLIATIDDLESGLIDFISTNSKGVDTLVINNKLKSVTPMLDSYKNYYVGTLDLKDKLNGTPSPSFEGYMNIDGSTTSLSDLKGKYVYVDVWASWCGPCKREIPFLKEVEKKYHGKNIAFVSLSVDDDRRSGTWEKAEQDWRDMIAEKELGGIQVLSPKGWDIPFIKEYEISGIPRFILIDPEGNIVDASAPRPSSDSLIKLFDAQNI